LGPKPALNFTAFTATQTGHLRARNYPQIDEQINSVRRELSNLLSIGIITSDNNNNKRMRLTRKFSFTAATANFGGIKKAIKPALPKTRATSSTLRAIGPHRPGRFYRSVRP